MSNTENDYNSKELEFAIFCIEKSNIISNYMVPEYEILHTQSKDYIVDDIIELMNEKGVQV